MFKYLLAGVSSLLLIACGQNEGGKTTAAYQAMNQPAAEIERTVNFTQVTRGGKLFQQYCAQCHGADGQGDPNWRQRDAEGFFPAPPLNGTGHAWHHPQKMLHHVIKNGSPGGKGKMPAWGNKLTDQDIGDIIAWFKAKWPQPVYEAWYGMNQKSGG